MLREYQYTERKTFRFTAQQIHALEKLERYGVSVSRFVRKAISEKIERDWPIIKEEKKRISLPF